MFTARTTGFRERWSIPATSWSAAVMPVRMSHTNTMTVAAAMAISACSRMKDRIWSSVPGSMPPVSTRSKVRPRHSAWAYSRSRVTPGVSSTMDRRLPVSLLNSMDLPTLGRPTIATRGLAMDIPPIEICQGFPLGGRLASGARGQRRFSYYKVVYQIRQKKDRGKRENFGGESNKKAAAGAAAFPVFYHFSAGATSRPL